MVIFKAVASAARATECGDKVQVVLLGLETIKLWNCGTTMQPVSFMHLGGSAHGFRHPKRLRI